MAGKWGSSFCSEVTAASYFLEHESLTLGNLGTFVPQLPKIPTPRKPAVKAYESCFLRSPGLPKVRSHFSRI